MTAAAAGTMPVNRPRDVGASGAMAQGAVTSMSEAQRTVPYGLCECGCGQQAPIAKQTSTRRGSIKGQPSRFVNGHQIGGGPVPRPIAVGERFGLLVALEARVPRMKRLHMRCDCGREVSMRIHNLISEGTQSCGCTRKVHGLALTRTYASWSGMIYRCTKPQADNYRYYGGRGITVCDRWQEPDGRGALNFLEDMGERPDDTTLDRIDVDGNYEPGNCRWATQAEQASNKRVHKRIPEATFTRANLIKLMAQAPRAFWRVDVDTDLAAGVRMARLAQVAGIRATFFLMTASEFYNVFSIEGEEAITAMLAAGQRIGLHCNYRGGDVAEVVQRDRTMTDIAYPGIFGDVVSFHMPPACVLWRNFGPSFTNAYAPEWKGRYVSDSRREWDETKAARVTNDAQVCLHAEWWTA